MEPPSWRETRLSFEFSDDSIDAALSTSSSSCPIGSAEAPTRSPSRINKRCRVAIGVISVVGLLLLLSLVCSYVFRSREPDPDTPTASTQPSEPSEGDSSKNQHGQTHDGSCHQIISNAKEIKQPADGSCLFHCLCFGLDRGERTRCPEDLRMTLAEFVLKNKGLEISGLTLEGWISAEHETSVEEYVENQKNGYWGGQIELFAFSLEFHVNVHVYRKLPDKTYKRTWPLWRLRTKRRKTYERTVCVDSPIATQKTVSILYVSGTHYDTLVVQHDGRP